MRRSSSMVLTKQMIPMIATVLLILLLALTLDG